MAEELVKKKRGTGEISQRVRGLEIEDSGIEEGDKCLCGEIEGGTPLGIVAESYDREDVEK